MAESRTPKLTWADYRLMWREFKPPAPTFTEKNLPSLDGKVIGISGGSQGVGYATVKMLAEHTNAAIYIFIRRLDDTKKLIADLKQEINKPDAVIEPIYVDYNDLNTVKPAAEEFLRVASRLDIMIHNAAVMNAPVEWKTKQGMNLDLQINALGCFALQKLLNPIMSKTAESAPANSVRIVWVGSSAHYLGPKTIINFDDPNYEHTTPHPNETYGQSKSIQALMAVQWRQKFKEMDKVVSTYCCPGYLATNLSRYYNRFSSFILKSILNPSEYGAYTLFWCAFSDEITTNESRKYVAPYGRFTKFQSEIEPNFYNEVGEKAWDFVEDKVKDYC